MQQENKRAIPCNWVAVLNLHVHVILTSVPAWSCALGPALPNLPPSNNSSARPLRVRSGLSKYIVTLHRRHQARRRKGPLRRAPVNGLETKNKDKRGREWGKRTGHPASRSAVPPHVMHRLRRAEKLLGRSSRIARDLDRTFLQGPNDHLLSLDGRARPSSALGFFFCAGPFQCHLSLSAIRGTEDLDVLGGRGHARGKRLVENQKFPMVFSAPKSTLNMKLGGSPAVAPTSCQRPRTTQGSRLEEGPLCGRHLPR